ncbi:MAG: NAD(P)-dependent oxidoreductase [Deltaproteobacteria bacterium]|nr:NAD(P)-dependent oxidoreductase [Deltaproteobacteria bacterium]
MKALVTGGSGFLGRYLVRELVKSGIEAVVFDKVINKDIFNSSENKGKIEFVEGDVLDFEAVYDAMDGCNLVFHTAAIADLDAARKTPVKTMTVNVIGTTNCLESAKTRKVDRFLFASTVYTAGNWGSFYRVSKQAGESLCKTYNDEFGMSYTILRYGSIYGRDANHWNFIYRVCKALLTTGEFTYISSKESVREYIHIFDVARETVRIAQDPEFSNKAVLITGHQRMKVEEFFNMIKEILGKDFKIHYTPADQRRHYVITPYSFRADIPVRVNLSTYVDISEGILDCIREIQKELKQDEKY